MGGASNEYQHLCFRDASDEAGHYSSVGSDVAWESRGTAIDPRVRHIFFREDLVMKIFLRPFFLFC